MRWDAPSRPPMLVFTVRRPAAAHAFHSDGLFRIVSVKKHEKHLHTGQIPTNISRAIELRNYFSVR
jgi:protein-arginine kinase activator protein McsA